MKIILSIMFLVILLIGWYFWSMLDKTYVYGPVRLTIKTDNNIISDDFYIVYGAAIYQMEGAHILYKKKMMVSNRNKIFIDEKIKIKFPSYFFVTVCHLLYSCGGRNVQQKNVKDEIDFGEVKLDSWKSRMDRNKDNSLKLQFIFRDVLNDTRRKYAPYFIKVNHKIDVKFYSEKLRELCVFAYKSKPELLKEKCSLTRFEELMKK